MPAIRAFVVLLACASFTFAADPAKLRTLSGKQIEGEIVKITDKEIILKTKDGEAATPLLEVLEVELAAGGERPPADAKYIDVELSDGSILHCGQFTLKKNQVELKLLLGQEIKMPLSAVAHVLNGAQDKTVREEWKKLVAKQGNRDMVAVKKQGVINGLEGTLGEGDEAGETIGFELRGGEQKVRLKLDRLHGMSFFRKQEGNREETLCKVHDTANNVLMVSKVVQTATGFTFTTVAGVTVEYPAPLLSKLDFSKGKLVWLSDLEPARASEASTLEGIDHYRRDKNLDGRDQIRIEGTIYSKGLSIPAYTELVYDIGGDYKEFKAVLGFDDQVSGDSNVKILIEGDNREIYKTELKRGDKKAAVKLNLDVKNVKLLRIVVSSVNILDLGDHVELADAKVSK